jgi:aspartate aminotransferase
MRAILSHVGAWAPKAEQIATARFLENPKAVNDYLNWFKPQVELRLRQLFEGFDELHKMGLPIEVIPPQAAIYLTIRFSLVGKTTKEGKRLNVQTEVTQYILDECHVAMVPFKAFGGTDQSEWYRISVGTLKLEDIPIIIGNIRKGLEQLH